MANTFTLIASSTVGSGGAANITFSSIAGTYTDLCVKISGRGDASGTSDAGIKLTFNGNTSSYSHRYLIGTGSAASSGTNAYSVGTASIYAGTMDATTATSNTFSNTEIYIPNYTSSNYKSVSIDSVDEDNTTLAYAVLIAGLWSNTAAITSVALTPTTGNFVQYSTAYLYGVKSS